MIEHDPELCPYCDQPIPPITRGDAYASEEEAAAFLDHPDLKVRHFFTIRTMDNRRFHGNGCSVEDLEEARSTIRRHWDSLATDDGMRAIEVLEEPLAPTIPGEDGASPLPVVDTEERAKVIAEALWKADRESREREALREAEIAAEFEAEDFRPITARELADFKAAAEQVKAATGLAPNSVAWGAEVELGLWREAAFQLCAGRVGTPATKAIEGMRPSHLVELRKKMAGKAPEEWVGAIPEDIEPSPPPISRAPCVTVPVFGKRPEDIIEPGGSFLDPLTANVSKAVREMAGVDCGKTVADCAAKFDEPNFKGEPVFSEDGDLADWADRAAAEATVKRLRAENGAAADLYLAVTEYFSESKAVDVKPDTPLGKLLLARNRCATFPAFRYVSAKKPDKVSLAYAHEPDLGVLGSKVLAEGIQPAGSPRAKVSVNRRRARGMITDLDYEGTIEFEIDLAEDCASYDSIRKLLPESGLPENCFVEGEVEITFVDAALFEAVRADAQEFAEDVKHAVRAALLKRLLSTAARVGGKEIRCGFTFGILPCTFDGDVRIGCDKTLANCQDRGCEESFGGFPGAAEVARAGFAKGGVVKGPLFPPASVLDGKEILAPTPKRDSVVGETPPEIAPRGDVYRG